MSFKCVKWACIVSALAIISNIGLIIFAITILVQSYGIERFIALLLFLPPVLSLMALRRGGDKEERELKSRIRKAHLRKELKELEPFDKV